MCWAMTRASTSGGIELVASRMSSRRGFSVWRPSTRVHRGVISVIPCTTSTRPPAVASERMRRPKASNGVVSRMPPTPATRRPFSGTCCGIVTRSMPGSRAASSTFTTRRLATIVRVSSSSHIRIGSPPPPLPPSASGSIATPGSFANRPSSTRPSASSTRSASAAAATNDAATQATARAATRAARQTVHGPSNASMRMPSSANQGQYSISPQRVNRWRQFRRGSVCVSRGLRDGILHFTGGLGRLWRSTAIWLGLATAGRQDPPGFMPFSHILDSPRHACRQSLRVPALFRGRGRCRDVAPDSRH